MRQYQQQFRKPLQTKQKPHHTRHLFPWQQQHSISLQIDIAQEHYVPNISPNSSPGPRMPGWKWQEFPQSYKLGKQYTIKTSFNIYNEMSCNPLIWRWKSFWRRSNTLEAGSVEFHQPTATGVLHCDTSCIWSQQFGRTQRLYPLYIVTNFWSQRPRHHSNIFVRLFALSNTCTARPRIATTQGQLLQSTIQSAQHMNRRHNIRANIAQVCDAATIAMPLVASPMANWSMVA